MPNRSRRFFQLLSALVSNVFKRFGITIGLILACGITYWMISRFLFSRASIASINDTGAEISSETHNWYDVLPDCPCELYPASALNGMEEVATLVEQEVPLNFGPGWSEFPEPANVFHPGAVYEIRWTDPTYEILAGQQCTYNATGQLITEGPAAGTPDRWGYSGALGAIGHSVVDVLPYIPAWLVSFTNSESNPELDWYLRNWQPNQGVGCPTIVAEVTQSKLPHWLPDFLKTRTTMLIFMIVMTVLVIRVGFWFLRRLINLLILRPLALLWKSKGRI